MLFADICDCSDGATLGKVGVALGAGQGQGPAPVSPLAALAVSPDLSTAVVTDTCQRALAVQLNTYFRYSSQGCFGLPRASRLPRLGQYAQGAGSFSLWLLCWSRNSLFV